MTVMEQVLGIVNDLDILPTAKLDYLGTAVPSVSVMQLPGAARAKTYIDGSGTVETPFAIDVRTTADDTDTASDIMRVLVELEATDGLTEPLLELYGESTPAMVDRDGKGNVIWRATGVVKWNRGTTESEE